MVAIFPLFAEIKTPGPDSKALICAYGLKKMSFAKNAIPLLAPIKLVQFF
jgi:hypothetical protein